MKEISIFIDESGDFGKLNPRSPYYIVTMVFHDQANDINACLDSLEQELTYLGYPHHCLHAGPIVRMENEFEHEDIVIRRKLLMKLMGFIRKIKIIVLCHYAQTTRRSLVRKHIEVHPLIPFSSKSSGTASLTRWINLSYDSDSRASPISSQTAIYTDASSSHLTLIMMFITPPVITT